MFYYSRKHTHEEYFDKADDVDKEIKITLEREMVLLYGEEFQKL